MHARTDTLSRLRAKGELTILETEHGVTVALKQGDHVIALSNQDEMKLLQELERLTRQWPDA